jgi:PAS domain S-box-containing protein
MGDNVVQKKRAVRKTTVPKDSATALRRKAERKLIADQARLQELSSVDLKKLVQELGTHQIELEMQNEELRRAQSELEASRRKYADLHDFSPMGYFTFDKSGLVREVNHTGAEMLGMEKRLLIGKPFQSCIKPDGRSLFREHLQEVFRQQTRQTCEISLTNKNGVEFPAQVQSIVVDSGEGTIDSCRTAVSDITERKKAEEEVGRLNKELQASLDELKAVNIDLETYSSAISNDLKAPLRSIEGFTNALLEDCSPAFDGACKGHCNRVVAACRRMSQMIEALLGIARLTKGQLREKSVDLSDLATVIIHELRKKQPERQVEVHIAQKLKVRGDTDMLRTVLENLLDNAWKFTSRHPAPKIEFGATEDGGTIVYFIRDNGAGFDSHYAEKLFQPFRRLHSEKDFPGLGIGLAMAQCIIQRHGGSIWAEGDMEKGATFFFTLQ